MAEAIFSTPIQNSVQKQLDSTLAAGASSVVLSEDVSALFTGTDATHPCVCVIDRIDSNGNLTPTKREYIKFTGVSTTTLTGCTRNADSSGSDQEHSVGAIVEFVPDVLWAKSLQDNYVDTSSTQTLSGKTLTSPVIATPTITNTGTITLPTATTTLVGTDTTDSLSNKTIVKPILTAGSHTMVADSDAETVTFDMDAGNIHTVTLADNRTLAVSNVNVGQCFIIRLVQDATGSRTATWWTNINWQDNTAPTLTTTAARTDVFGFLCSSTDNYDGFIIGQDLPD